MLFCVENNLPYSKAQKITEFVKDLVKKKNIDIMKKVFVERDSISTVNQSVFNDMQVNFLLNYMRTISFP